MEAGQEVSHTGEKIRRRAGKHPGLVKMCSQRQREGGPACEGSAESIRYTEEVPAGG